MKYILDRITELDTFSSVILFATGLLGIVIAPEVIEAWHVVIMWSLGGLGIVTPDSPAE